MYENLINLIVITMRWRVEMAHDIRDELTGITQNCVFMGRINQGPRI